MKNMKNQWLGFLLVGVISLAIGFYGGIIYQRNQTRSRFIQFGSQMGQFSRGQNGQNSRFGQGVRPIRGEIIKKDNDSIVVKLLDGSTKIVFLTEKTSLTKSTNATVEDLKEKETVFVIGQENSDGSITAENIQIR